MHITLISQKYIPNTGGIENSLKNLARTFVSKGHTVEIICSDVGPAGNRLPSHEVIDGIPVYRYRSAHLPGYLQVTILLLNALSLRKLFVERNKKRISDLVIFRDIRSGIWLDIPFIRTPTIYIAPADIHRLESGRCKIVLRNGRLKWHAYAYLKFIYHPVLSLAQKLVLKYANTVVCWSGVMITQLSRYGYNQVYKQINPGVDLDLFSNSKMEQKGVIAIIARFDALKNISIAIEAISLLNRDVVLEITGGGPEVFNLKALSQELGVEDKVRFLGVTNRPHERYARADIFLMTSIYESFGQTIIEAMACGLPVIAFRRSKEINTASEEIIKDGVTGFLIENTPQALANAISDYYHLEEEKKYQLSHNARSYIEQNHTWAKTCNELLKLYQEIVNRG